MSKLAKALTAAAGNAGGDNLYVEDVFSTYLYDGGNGSGTNQAVNVVNDVNLNEEGGLVWLKRRDVGNSHALIDTERGRTQWLNTDTTSAAISATGIDSFNTDGFTVSSTGYGETNNYNGTYASWTFRKAEKFFDVVTYTGNGGVGREISHNLGSVPGMIIVKCTSDSTVWPVYHKKSGSGGGVFVLNQTNAELSGGSSYFGDQVSVIDPTDSVFTVGALTAINDTGKTYVAYLFASDAGGFGDDGSESIIKCGSYTGTDTTQEITLGFEPQWVLIKSTGATSEPWALFDVMRGMPVGGVTQYLRPNTSDAETNGGVEYISPTPTGFKLVSGSTLTNSSFDTGGYIYIAIRRPMKTPESGTEVFAIDQWDGATTLPTAKSGFPVDMAIWKDIDGSDGYVADRMRGRVILRTNTTGAETSSSAYGFDYQNGYLDVASNDATRYSWMFKRATGFFDVVAYTGDGVAGRTLPHNLGVAPEMVWFKKRSAARSWYVHVDPLGITNGLILNSNSSEVNIGALTAKSATDLTLTSSTNVNDTSTTYIAYLFATLPGVSKVGSYTGTGSSQTIDCGFSAGARFVLIKRTDANGDWNVFDTARGIVTGTDNILALNTTAAESAYTDVINPNAAGFEVTSNTGDFNLSGASYIFLAIA